MVPECIESIMAGNMGRVGTEHCNIKCKKHFINQDEYSNSKFKQSGCLYRNKVLC